MSITIEELYQSTDEAIREGNEKFDELYRALEYLQETITQHSEILHQTVAKYNCLEMEYQALKRLCPPQLLEEFNTNTILPYRCIKIYDENVEDVNQIRYSPLNDQSKEYIKQIDLKNLLR